jgi:hypothetical protein
MSAEQAGEGPLPAQGEALEIVERAAVEQWRRGLHDSTVSEGAARIGS